jgi:hypothetical protein
VLWCALSLYALCACSVRTVNLSFIPWGSVECVATVTFYTKLALVSCVPPAVLFLVWCVPWAVLHLLNRFDQRDDNAARDERRVIAHKCLKLAAFSLSLLYPAVSQTILSFFNVRALNASLRQQRSRPLTSAHVRSSVAVALLSFAYCVPSAVCAVS